jgi:hypothetical protein
MLFNSNIAPWAVAQYKDYSYICIEKNKYSLNPLHCPANTVVTGLMPIGPIILVEWEE